MRKAKKQREDELKDIKRLANEVLTENLVYDKIANGWQKRVLEKNISNLKNIIKDINNDLRRENIERYIKTFQDDKLLDVGVYRSPKEPYNITVNIL